MKYMKTINEAQAIFTKLRREIQRGEAPKKGDISETYFHNGSLYDKKTAGECYVCVDKKSPGYGFRASYPPDLPLHVRVAKLVGLPVPDKLTVEWAMGAWKEYCRKVNHWGKVICLPTINKEWGWMVRILHDNGKEYHVTYDSLPQAICEAICAHAESR